VDQAGGVHRTEPLGERDPDLQRLLGLEPPARADQAGEGAPLEQRHREEWHLVALACVDDVDDRGMTHSREGIGLAAQSRAQDLVHLRIVQRQLERDGASHQHVLGREYDRSGAATQHSSQLIAAADDRADFQWISYVGTELVRLVHRATRLSRRPLAAAVGEMCVFTDIAGAAGGASAGGALRQIDALARCEAVR
jgi:hypothetical protein